MHRRIGVQSEDKIVDGHCPYARRLGQPRPSRRVSFQETLMSAQQSTDQTLPPWQSQETPVVREVLERDICCDICIIGAGIAGLATAYELVCQGKKVVVLDDG